MRPALLLAVVVAAGALLIPNASVYSKRFAGRKTSSGTRYRPERHTVAHRHLPLGTCLEITNRKNGKSTHALVTDRGPWVRHRQLDLSTAVASSLGIRGLGSVSYKQVQPAECATH